MMECMFYESYSLCGMLECSILSISGRFHCCMLQRLPLEPFHCCTQVFVTQQINEERMSARMAKLNDEGSTKSSKWQRIAASRVVRWGENPNSRFSPQFSLPGRKLIRLEMDNKSEDPQSWENDWGRRAWELLKKLRSKGLLIQCITNFVSMDLMANILLAAGASPAMLHSTEEIPDFTPSVDALCINIGTLSHDWLSSMRAAAASAKASGRPWVLDPVAFSASNFRVDACLSLLDYRPAAIRGNASEILGLASARRVSDAKGVDSSHQSSDVVEAAKSLSRSSGAIVAVSGAIDYITDGRRVYGAKNGVAMLQKITATGCSVTALIAAFIAAEPAYPLEATACALSAFGVAAELGMEKAGGPASLRMHLVDSLHGLDEHALTTRVSIFRLS